MARSIGYGIMPVLSPDFDQKEFERDMAFILHQFELFVKSRRPLAADEVIIDLNQRMLDLICILKIQNQYDEEAKFACGLEYVNWLGWSIRKVIKGPEYFSQVTTTDFVTNCSDFFAKILAYRIPVDATSMQSLWWEGLHRWCEEFLAKYPPKSS